MDGVERRIEIISKKNIIFASPNDYAEFRPEDLDYLRERHDQMVRPSIIRNIVKRTNSVDVDFE